MVKANSFNPLNFGISSNQDQVLVRKIRLINIINILATAINVFFLMILAWLHLWNNMILNVAMILILVYISLMVKKGNIKKVFSAFFIIFPIYFLFFVFIYGDNGVKYYFIALAVMSALLLEQKLMVKRTFLLMLLFFLLSDIYPRFFPAIDDNQLKSYFYFANLTFSFLLIFASIGLYKDQQIMYENELKESNKVLEMKNEEISLQNEEIASQRDNLLELNTRINEQHEELDKAFRQITDSAKYARRIQSALLPLPSELNKVFADSFIINQPKNIVSGDFYWFISIEQSVEYKTEKIALLAIGDCTGHGIPGAFLSAIGINMLHQIVNDMKIYHPADILLMLDKLLTERLLQQTIDNLPVYDGIDMALIAYFPERNMIEFSGAKRPLWLFQESGYTEFKGSKHSIGLFKRGDKEFEQHNIQVTKGETIYLFSDGYPDQTGGPRHSKFLTSNFREMMLSQQGQPMHAQQAFLLKTFQNWKQNTTQTDDVLVIGIQI